MAQGATIRVEGLRELQRDFGRMGHRIRGELQRELKKVAEPVARDTQARLERFGGRTVSGVRIKARGASVFVEQSTRKTTGLRGDFGALQMRTAFLPALASKEDETIRELEDFLDRFTSQYGFGGGGVL